MATQFKLATGAERLQWRLPNKPPTPLYGTYLNRSHRKNKNKAPLKPIPDPKRMMNTISLMIETSSDIKQIQPQDLQPRAISLSNGKKDEIKQAPDSVMKRILFTFSNESSPRVDLPTSKPNLPRPPNTDRSTTKPPKEATNLIRRPMNSNSAAQLLPASIHSRDSSLERYKELDAARMRPPTNRSRDSSLERYKELDAARMRPPSTHSRESSLERYRELDAAINSMAINTRGRRETLKENTKPQRPPEPRPAGSQARQGRYLRSFHNRPKVPDIYPQEAVLTPSPVSSVETVTLTPAPDLQPAYKNQ